MTIFSKRDDEGRSGRADSRKSKRNRLFWLGAWESLRLEPRTLMTLTVTNFPIPLVEIVKPDGITTGSDGNLWFTENAAGKIGRMTPAGVVTSFVLPDVPPPEGSPAGTAGTTPNPTAIAAGPDGSLWFTGIPGEIGRITTAGVVTEFPLPAVPPPAGSPAGTASTPATATAIVAGPDGALWFTGVPGEIGRISTTGVVTEFAVPEIPPPAGSAPGTAATPATLAAITAGPDGALWFTGVPGEVGKITTAGVVTEFAVPAIPPPAGSSPGTAGTPATLEDVTAGPDGALWFTGVPGEVGRITTAGVVSEFATPNFAPPNSPFVTTITIGPDGNLWLTGNTGSGGNTAIGRITPTGTFTSFNVPGNYNTIAGLTSGPGGNLWFTEQEDGITGGEQPAIGEITPAGMMTLHAIPQGTTLDPNLGVPADPNMITTGPDGALWFGENGAIGRITTAGAIQQFPLPTPGATVGDITPGPGGAVWFTLQNPDGSDSIGRITPTGAITEYPLQANWSVGGITEGPGGDLWFTENFTNPNTAAQSLAIGRLTPEGDIKTLVLPMHGGSGAHGNPTLGAIEPGPDGQLWFMGTSGADGGTGCLCSGQQNPILGIFGQITGRGSVHLSNWVEGPTEGNPYAPEGAFIRGPDGKLWYSYTTGINRVSSDGAMSPALPASNVASNLVGMPDGQVWFETSSPGLGLATRSGIVVTQDLPALNIKNNTEFSYGPANSMTAGPDGNLWLTTGESSIQRVSGLDSVSGSLDYRHRPKRAPDYAYDPSTYDDQWTNVSGTAKPTFAGVAAPGAELTLWAQKQGENAPVSIGQVEASKSDGSWTLKSQVTLSNGYYAVTASQTADPGPPSVLYSLAPDPSGNLSNALVIHTRHAGK